MRLVLILLLSATPSRTPSPVPTAPADASATQRGLVNISTQVLGGKKNFAGGAESVFLDAGTSRADIAVGDTFVSTNSRTGTANDGGANFSCSSNPGTTSPCLDNSKDVMEIYGTCHGDPYCTHPNAGSTMYLITHGHADSGYILEVMNDGAPAANETGMFFVSYKGDVSQNGIFLNLNTATSSSGGRITSPNGGIYLISTSGEVLVENDATGNVMSWYGGAGPTLAGVIKNDGTLDLATGPSSNTCTLNGGTPSTCTVTTFSGAKCVCTPVGTTAVIANNGCAVSLSGTTLTVTSATGANNDVNVDCH